MLMVFAVTFALIIISQIFLFKNKPEERSRRRRLATNAAEQPVLRLRRLQPRRPQPTPERRTSLLKSAATSAERKAASSEVETVVENNLYRIVFTNAARR